MSKMGNYVMGLEEERMEAQHLEIVARKLAAIKMGLVKDVDGERIPDDLWQQMIPQAKELQQTWDLIPQ